MVGLWATASERRRERASWFVFEADQRCCLVAGELLAHVLARHGVTRGENELAENTHGKPYLVHRPDLHFNVSHSGDWAVCAVGSEELDVDVERCSPDAIDVARRFAPEEFAYIHGGSLSRGKRRTVHRGMDPQGELREVPRAGTRGGPGRLLSLGRGTAFTAAEWGGRTDTVPASDPPKGRGIPSPTAGGRQRPRRRGGSSAGVARCSRRRGGGSGDARGTTHPPTDRPAPLSRAAARRAGS